MQNLYRVDMIGFSVIQKSLIAFQNDDQDELFIHYDDRTKQRLRKLNINLTDTEGQAHSIKDISYKLLNIIDMLLRNKTDGKKKGKSGGNGEDDEDNEEDDGDGHGGGGDRGGGRSGNRNKKGKSRFKKNKNNRGDYEDDGGGSWSRSQTEREEWDNPHDKVPIDSEYTRKLKDGIDIYKRTN